MGLRMKNFNINPIFRATEREFQAGVCQKLICRGNCLNREELGQFADLSGGACQKKKAILSQKKTCNTT